MIKKLSFLMFIGVYSLGFSQIKKGERLKPMINISTFAALNLETLKKERDYSSGYNPNYQFGIEAEAGYQLLSWWAVSGGVRYHYMEPRFHLLSYTLGAYFFVTPTEDLSFGYINLKYGQQFNQSLINNAQFIHLGAGQIDISETRPHLAQKLEVFIENHQLIDSHWFIGISYGITLYRNKN